MSNLYFPICGFLISLLIVITFFSKKRVDTTETRIFSVLVIAGFLNSLLSVLIIYLAYAGVVDEILQALNKLDFIQLILWSWMFATYTFYISFSERKNISKYKTKLFHVTIALNVIFIMIMLILPVHIYNTYYIMYAYGPSTDVVYIVACVYLAASIIFTLTNLKKIGSKKYRPILALILLAVILLLVRQANPSLLLISPMLAYINLIMFQTIENPDLKLVKEKELARVQAEKANQAKSDFLSSMSHEIRTPLNTIKGFSELTVEATDIDVKEAKENAKEVVKASEVLLEIINGVLDISKIESGSIEIKNQNYNPVEMLNNTCNMINIRMKEKGLDFQINIAEDIPETLYGDSTKIQQALINLLSNAVKYTNEGHVKINVQCINKADNCGLFIAVEDSGRGIKTEQIDKLFSKFLRLEEDRNTTTEGTGLGLAIAKQLIEMMDGKITVQTMYGIGSQFTITVNQKIIDPSANSTPVYEPEPKENLPEPKEQEGTPANTIIPTEDEFIEIIGDTASLPKVEENGKRVLVVDDNKLNLKIATKVLEQYKLNITQCETPFEVLEKIENGAKYDLILADDMMPKMTGTEMMKKLKSKGYTTPIVVLTANVKAGDKEHYLEEGFEDYLGKPIDRKELDRVLKKYLNQ